jgi:uncharacterized protein (TIGR03083 family)
MDAVEEWGAAYERVRELVSGLDEQQAGTVVPACPDWTVRELLSHMVGLGADVLRGDEPDDHNSTWTQRHVDERSDRSVGELLEEWATVAEPLQQWMRENTTRPLGDIVIHEQDLRGALGVSGAQQTDGLAALRDRMVGGFGEQVHELAPVALVGDRWSWCSSGVPQDAAVVVRATDFDLTRALMTRRSESQLRGWTERGDIGAYLPGFSMLGRLPVADLSE